MFHESLYIRVHVPWITLHTCTCSLNHFTYVYMFTESLYIRVHVHWITLNTCTCSLNLFTYVYMFHESLYIRVHVPWITLHTCTCSMNHSIIFLFRHLNFISHIPMHLSSVNFSGRFRQKLNHIKRLITPYMIYPFCSFLISILWGRTCSPAASLFGAQLVGWKIKQLREVYFNVFTLYSRTWNCVQAS